MHARPAHGPKNSAHTFIPCKADKRRAQHKAANAHMQRTRHTHSFHVKRAKGERNTKRHTADAHVKEDLTRASIKVRYSLSAASSGGACDRLRAALAAAISPYETRAASVRSSGAEARGRNRAQGTGRRAQGTERRAQGGGHRAEGTGRRTHSGGHRAEGTGRRRTGGYSSTPPGVSSLRPSKRSHFDGCHVFRTTMLGFVLPCTVTRVCGGEERKEKKGERDKEMGGMG